MIIVTSLNSLFSLSSLNSLLLYQTLLQYKFYELLIEIYRCDKLFDRRNKMAFTFELDLEERIEIVVVEIDNLTLGATDAHLKADKIVKIELVALDLLNLEHKFVVENHLGTLLGVDVGKCNNRTALAATSE